MNDRPSDAAGAGALAAGGIRERLRTFNPVLDRELRQRSRSMRSMWMIFTALAFLTLVLWLAYSGESSQPGFSSPLQSLATQVGQITFEWVLAVELTVLLFLIPGVSSGAIAGERDRQTLMPLQITLMRPTGIFVGMVLASSGFVLLLVAASVPVMTVPFLLGGVSLADVIASLLCLLAVGLLIAVISVGCSAIFRRATTATLAAYGTMLALTLGTALIAWFTALIDGARGFDEAKPLPATLYPNPFAALSDIGGKARTTTTGRSARSRTTSHRRGLGASLLKASSSWTTSEAERPKRQSAAGWAFRCGSGRSARWR